MELPPKQDVARALLLSGSMFIHLDPRVEGVMVPKWLKRQPQLVLQIGLDMAIPIPDLRVDEHGVYGTLSFNRSPFTCLVPWEAIFAVAGEDGRGMVWPESMPAEITAEIEREAGRRAPAELSDAADLGEDDGEAAETPDDVPGVIPLRPARSAAPAQRDPRERKGAPSEAATQRGSAARQTQAEKPAARRAVSPESSPAEEPTSGEPTRPNGKGRALPPYLRVIK
jgi:stringent starvation protein B